MIYLIGGTPRSGKTTVAKKLAADLNISWISADTLEGLAKHFTPLKQHLKKFPKNVLRKNTANSNDLMYTKYTAAQITKAYIEQAKSSWEVIETLIEYLIGEDYDYIIEGHQVAPKLATQLQKKYGKKVKAIFLTRHSVKNIVEAAKQGTAHNDWFIKKTKNEDTYPKIAQMIALYGNYLKKEAAKFHYKSFNMDGNFKITLEKAIKQLKQ